MTKTQTDWDAVSFKLSNITVDLVDRQGKEKPINLKIDLEGLEQRQKLAILEIIKYQLNSL